MQPVRGRRCSVLRSFPPLYLAIFELRERANVSLEGGIWARKDGGGGRLLSWVESCHNFFLASHLRIRAFALVLAGLRA